MLIGAYFAISVRNIAILDRTWEELLVLDMARQILMVHYLLLNSYPNTWGTIERDARQRN